MHYVSDPLNRGCKTPYVDGRPLKAGERACGYKWACDLRIPSIRLRIGYYTKYCLLSLAHTCLLARHLPTPPFLMTFSFPVVRSISPFLLPAGQDPQTVTHGMIALRCVWLTGLMDLNFVGFLQRHIHLRPSCARGILCHGCVRLARPFSLPLPLLLLPPRPRARPNLLTALSLFVSWF